MIGESETDPLLDACDCKGSMKYIHLGCLRKWNKDKISTRVTSTSTVSLWKQLKCEICHYHYPDTIQHKSEEYELVDRPETPSEPHLLLELVAGETS